MIRPWRSLSSEIVARGKVFAVRRDRVQLPDQPDQVVDYTYLEQASGALVVALHDDRTTILVEQYRYPTRAPSLEFPAGAVADGEDAAQAARRELAEEIGCAADDLQQVGTLHQSAAISNARAFVYLARGLRPGQPHREATEQMERRTVPFAQVEALIRDGVIRETTTIASYYLVKALLAQAPPTERRRDR